MTGAIAAAVGSLAGVLGTTIYASWHRRQEAKQRRRSAALLVRADLQLAGASLTTALDDGLVISLLAVSLPTWDRHGWELTTLPVDDLETVLGACTKITNATERARLVYNANRLRPMPKIDRIRGLPQAIEHAILLADAAVNVLGPVAYPGEELRPWPPPDRFAG